MSEAEDKLREQQLRGEEAARLKDNALLKEVFDGLKADCVHRWINTPIDAVDMREDAWKMHKAIELLQGKLVTSVANGEFARKQLQQQKEKDA